MKGEPVFMVAVFPVNEDRHIAGSFRVEQFLIPYKKVADGMCICYSESNVHLQYPKITFIPVQMLRTRKTLLMENKYEDIHSVDFFQRVTI